MHSPHASPSAVEPPGPRAKSPSTRWSLHKLGPADGRPTRNLGRSGPDLLAVLALALLTLVCFASLAADPTGLLVDADRASLDNTLPGEQRVVGNDLTFLFLPHYLNLTAHLERSGRIPYWDSWGFAGRPLVGNPQAGLFYPPVWAAWVARTPAALGWLTVAHVFWSGIGGYVLARSLRMSRFAALVAGGCFEASPILLAHAFEGHYPHVWSTAWYPWAFWAFFQHRAGRRYATLALPLFLAMAFLAGHPQEWYYLILALSAWTTVDAVRAALAGRRRTALGTLAVWAGLIALNVGLVAIEFLPDFAAQRWTPRNGMLATWQVNTYNPRLINLLQLLSPNALGTPADYFGHTNYWEALVSVGLVPLILGVIAVAKAPDRRAVRGWLILTVTALIFAGGRRLGLFSVLYTTIPGMSFFRVPSRSLLLAALGAGMLAGFGIDALRALAASAEDWRLIGRRFRTVAAIIVASLAVGATFCWLDDPAHPSRPRPPATTRRVRVKSHEGSRVWTLPRSDDELDRVEEVEPPRWRLAAFQITRDPIFWLAVGGSGLALACASLGFRARRAAVCALGLVALVELAWNGHALLKVAPARRFLEVDPISIAMQRCARSAPKPFRIRAVDQYYDDLHARANDFDKININDWFQVERASDLYKELYSLFDEVAPCPLADAMGEPLLLLNRVYQQAILDRLGIAFLVSDHVVGTGSWDVVETGKWNGRPFVVYRNPTALPRAYVVPRAQAEPTAGKGLLPALREVNPREAAILDRDPLSHTGALARQSFTPADVVAGNDPDRFVVHVATEAPGLLVVADTWMPGWSATVDGRRVPILRGNHAQRVVALPEPGTHEVVMTYRPPQLTAGCAISGVAAVTWLGLVFLAASGRRAARITTNPESTRVLHVAHTSVQSECRASGSSFLT